MKTIVALVDLTDASAKVVKHAHLMASAFGSHVVLLHVVPPEPIVATLGAEAPAVPLPPSPELIQADKARLQEHLDYLTSRDVNATALQFEGPVAQTVIEETQRLNADLVIMGSHHHNTLYQLFVGSVTADILKNSHFPILVLPATVPETTAKRSPSAEEVRQNQAILQPVLSA